MIRVDLHTHTNHSHARDSVREMFEAGQAKGLVVQGFSEHSPRPLGYDYPVEYREHLAYRVAGMGMAGMGMEIDAYHGRSLLS